MGSVARDTPRKGKATAALVTSVAEKPRCPKCDRILTTLYRQRRGPPPKPGELGKIRQESTPWLECTHCDAVYDSRRPGKVT